MAKVGKFIVFEGGEGTGKTTQIHVLKQKLEALGQRVVLTFEPGGTPLGERIRSILLDPDSGKVDAKCEALLYAAARAEHVSKIIKPALDSGAIVLCDRYWDASRAYQGVARSLGVAAIDRINIWATGATYPELVFLFDLNPDEGLARAKERNLGKLDRLEAEGLSFHEQVRAAYLWIAARNPDTHTVVDARLPVDEITKSVWARCQVLLGTLENRVNGSL